VVGWEAVGKGIWRKRDWPVQWRDWGKGHPGWESGKPPYSPVKRWPNLNSCRRLSGNFGFFFVGEFGVSRLLLETEWAKRGWDVL